MYLAHRLAWLYVYGVWPVGQVDHINHNRADNMIKNIRDTTSFGNQQNQIKANVRNKSTGLLGTSFHKGTGKYQAKIVCNGKQIYIGIFETAKEAHKAYLKTKRKLHTTNTL